MDDKQPIQVPTQASRKRPLITYSKRPPANGTPEPVPKKRRIWTVESLAKHETTDFPQLQELPPPPKPPVLPEGTVIRKGSILHYFKPGRVTSSQSSELCSDPDKLSLVSSSPSRGGTLSQENELREIPDLPSIRKREGNGVETRKRPEKIEDDEAANVVEDRIVSADEKENEKNSDGETPQGSGRRFGDGGDELANRRSRRRWRQRREPGTARKKAVQTTLSLSAKPAFDECRTCGMVYNPLHPNDAKLHARRHKAAVKKAGIMEGMI